MHGLDPNNVGRSYSKERHWDAKKIWSGGSVSMKSYSRKITSEDFSNSDTRTSVSKRNKRRSQNYITKEFKKAKLPTFER